MTNKIVLQEAINEYVEAAVQEALCNHAFGKQAPLSLDRAVAAQMAKHALGLELDKLQEPELRPTDHYYLNGVKRPMPSASVMLSYETISAYCGYMAEQQPTITWSTAAYQSSLVPGDVVVVSNGMVINCMITSKA